MERIDIQPGSFFPASLKPKREEVKKKGGAGKSQNVFSRLFSSEQANAETDGLNALGAEPISQEEAEELFQSIQAAGEKLLQYPSREAVLEYQVLIRNLVGRAVRHGIVVEEFSSGSHVLKRKSFSLIKVVDQKLDQLAAGVLVTQRDQIQLLAKVQEIQGLLIDMLH
ncbi:MAG: DUF327 family protein [Spirochaetaceae bacterium]|nr:MAG: DUF327 family protein [Spirochaetaceae bacterium]